MEIAETSEPAPLGLRVVVLLAAVAGVVVGLIVPEVAPAAGLAVAIVVCFPVHRARGAARFFPGSALVLLGALPAVAAWSETATLPVLLLLSATGLGILGTVRGGDVDGAHPRLTALSRLAAWVAVGAALLGAASLALRFVRGLPLLPKDTIAALVAAAAAALGASTLRAHRRVLGLLDHPEQWVETLEGVRIPLREAGAGYREAAGPPVLEVRAGREALVAARDDVRMGAPLAAVAVVGLASLPAWQAAWSLPWSGELPPDLVVRLRTPEFDASVNARGEIRWFGKEGVEPLGYDEDTGDRETIRGLYARMLARGFPRPEVEGFCHHQRGSSLEVRAWGRKDTLAYCNTPPAMREIEADLHRLFLGHDGRRKVVTPYVVGVAKRRAHVFRAVSRDEGRTDCVGTDEVDGARCAFRVAGEPAAPGRRLVPLQGAFVSNLDEQAVFAELPGGAEAGGQVVVCGVNEVGVLPTMVLAAKDATAPSPAPTAFTVDFYGMPRGKPDPPPAYPVWRLERCRRYETEPKVDP